MKKEDESKVELKELYKVMFTGYPDVVDVPQLWEMLGGTTIKSVYKLLREGKITAYRIGKGYRIPKLSIIKYLIDTQKSVM